MRAKDRHSAIESELRIRGEVTVASLAKRLAASTISIRRDLNALEGRGVARRVHGGAVFSGEPTTPPALRTTERVREKTTRKMIGLVVPGTAYYYAGIIAGAEEMASAMGYRLILAVSNYCGEKERRHIGKLVSIGAQGMVVAPSVHDAVDTATYDLLVGLNMPVVLMERKAHVSGLDAVYSEHSVGIGDAMRYLRGAGHRGVILLASEHSATTPALKAGFLRAVAGFEARRCQVFVVPPAPAQSPEQRAYLALTLARCQEIGATAVIAHSDELAIDFTELAQRKGARVPEDLSIVSYDDEVAALAHPPPDAVAPPKREVGRRAVRLCVERIERGFIDTPAQHIGLMPHLVLRSSSAPRP